MRLRSGLLIGIFGLIVVLLGGWFFTLATALITYIALLEFFKMAEFKGIKPATKTTLFSSFVIIICTYLETIGFIEGEILNSKKTKSLELLKSPFKLVQAPEIEIGIAWRSKTSCISFSQSLNKISGDIICPYPPGIPLIIPGEKIDLDRFNWINNKSLCNKDLLNFNIRVI